MLLNYCFLSCRQHRDGLDTARAPSGQRQGSCGSYPFNKLPLEPYALPLYSERDFFCAQQQVVKHAHVHTRSLVHTLPAYKTRPTQFHFCVFLLLQVGSVITFCKIATSVRNCIIRERSHFFYLYRLSLILMSFKK